MFCSPELIASNRSTKTSALLLAALCCLTLSLQTTPATAQDQVGIYWDTDYSQSTLTLDPVPGGTTGYVVITDPSVAGGIVGWELCFEKTGGGFVHSWDLAGQAINLESEPCFSVALNAPLLPTGNAILLASFQTYMATGEPASFYLNPIPSSQDEQMSYVPAADTRYPIELFAANSPGPVAQIVTNTPWAIFNTQALDFDSSAIGSAAIQNIIVENGGGSDLELDISLSQDCEVFTLPDVSGPVTLAPGAVLTIPVAFTPLAVQGYSCSVSFGPSVPTSVSLNGVGRVPNYQYTLYSDRDFGDLFVGDGREMDVVIRNSGYDPIPIVPSLLGCGSDFEIVSGGEPTTLNRLDARTVVVRFQPTAADSFACALSFGEDINQVGLMGIGRATGLNFEAPTEVAFGEHEAGRPSDTTVVIHNTGTVSFVISPALVGCGNEFTISSGAQDTTVEPGTIGYFVVRFQPLVEGDFSCVLSLGAIVPDIPISGQATPATERWSLSSTSIYFPPTIERGFYETAIRVYNRGIIDFDIDAQLVEADPEFTIFEGAGFVDLEGLTSHLIRLRFQPNGPGPFSAILDLGSTVPQVNITGTSYAPFDSCGVSIAELNFGSNAALVPATTSFIVRNHGNRPLSVTPTSDSPHFSVPTAPFTLAAGGQSHVYVIFSGPELGSYEATVNLGSEFCAEVLCRGEVADTVDPGPDGIGIFFDEGLASNEIHPPINLPFNAYLVLFNPTNPSPIAGWEARLEIDGPAFVLRQTFPEPEINIGTSPDYVVAYQTPLPWAPVVKLLTLELLTVTPSQPVTFSLSPTTVPAVPGQMSWMTETFDTFVRMNTSTGQSVVATVYGVAPVGIEVPSPMLSRLDGQVHLSWPAPLQPGSSCHVYRRTANTLAERLTTQPLDAGAGALEFTDNPTGFDAGTTLYYSYAVIIDGVENARSLEVEYTFEAPRILTSQLLPNVPNPFNPQTKIRFELAQSSEVRVSIFDVTGRLVKVLENGTLGAGEYSRTWQGRDEGGRPVASGAYYVRLVMDNKVDHQKIMLLK